jgi:plasmid replication initiation protein
VSKRRDLNPEFDLFIPAIGDFPLKDQREVMEWPFFSLQKRKRLKPIKYKSPDDEAWVRVHAIPDYGMATKWDADILIWAASTLNRMKQQGLNDVPRTLTTPYDLLRAIKRSTGGKDYQRHGRSGSPPGDGPKQACGACSLSGGLPQTCLRSRYKSRNMGNPR